jgi:aspartyl-tRNA(Asn)/glutamyl-tRNA(Gln) amidotransferase subunit B
MRSKEESEDYRYFQEPDLLPLFIDEEWRRRVRSRRPELPAEKRARFSDLGADTQTAALLVDSPELATLYEGAIAGGADPRTIGIWLTGEVVAYLRRHETTIEATGLGAADLIELAAMTSENSLSATAAKEVLGGVLAGEGNPEAVAQARDLLLISDAVEIESAVDAVLGENDDAVQKIRGGDMKPVGFLVGQVMQATGGRADPKIVQELVRAKATDSQ